MDRWSRELSPIPDSKGGRKGGGSGVGGEKNELYKLAVELRDRLRFRYISTLRGLHGMHE